MATLTTQLPPAPAHIISRPTNMSRTSHFSEGPMEEYTPAVSIYQSAANAHRDRRYLRRWMRVFNALVHLTACILLLINMAGFLAEFQGMYLKYLTPAAIALCVLLSMDSTIDILSLVRVHWQWPGWSLLLRLACGLGYLVVFLVYATHGRVFPNQYSYWGFSANYAGPLVYLFLWLVSVWDLIHFALHRQPLGRDVWVYMAGMRSMQQRVRDRIGKAKQWARRRDGNGSGADLESGQTAGGASPSPERRPEMKMMSTVTTTSSAESERGPTRDEPQAEIQL